MSKNIPRIDGSKGGLKLVEVQGYKIPVRKSLLEEAFYPFDGRQSESKPKNGRLSGEHNHEFPFQIV